MMWTFVATIFACAAGDTPDSAMDVEVDIPAECDEDEQALGVTWDGFADGFFRSYCNGCHAAGAPDRVGAPPGVSFDDASEALRWEARIRARVLVDGDMPPAGGVPEADRTLLSAYFDCATP